MCKCAERAERETRLSFAADGSIFRYSSADSDDNCPGDETCYCNSNNENKRENDPTDPGRTGRISEEQSSIEDGYEDKEDDTEDEFLGVIDTSGLAIVRRKIECRADGETCVELADFSLDCTFCPEGESKSSSPKNAPEDPNPKNQDKDPDQDATEGRAAEGEAPEADNAEKDPVAATTPAEDQPQE